ncbi:MAG: BREX-1 system phosphatase PglZ type A, partial [Angelakisella sp.]
LIAMLLMTYTDHCCKGALPKAYQQFVSPKRNDVAVFVSNLMNNLMCKERYDALADTMGRKLKLSQYIVAEDVEQYFACDSFEIFDRLIIAYFAQKLAENGTALAPQYREIVKIRATKSHFSAQFSGYYRALSRADKLIVAIEDFSHDVQCTPDGMVAQYAAKWYHIDRYYRQFYAAFDRLEDSTPLLDLREMVENLYTNGYLAKLSIAWAEKLESLPSYGDLTGSKQYQFYKNVALPASHKERTVVIISDAFRFECAGELCRRLTVTPNVVSAELTPMLSVLPSYTRLGMAALLPHKNLTLTEDFQVLVDGCKCQSSGERGSILTAENREAVVLKYDEVKVMSREEVRKVCADKTLLYIYHDQIDARGDNAATENEVFTAADEAIAEIMGLVQKLTSNRGITSYIITADHGFLYKRDKLQEYDKVSLGKIGDERINKRYLLSKGNPPEIEGTLSYSMGYLDESLGETYVTVPRGVDIFKAPGGGQNYVHGGLALQEVVVPLLRVKTNEKKKETDGVKVVLTSLSRKITNLITYLDFIQTENISDTLHPVKLSVFFESESGERVSDEEIIVADKKNTQPASRQFHEKFTFRNRKYTKDEKYELVMMDLDAGVEVERNAFQIDIAFADDFGFNV